MGNVAIAFINSTVALNEFLLSKYNARLEHKRIASLIPRYLSRLNRSDSSITTLNLNNLGVDCNIIKKLASPLYANASLCVEELYLENNQIGSEGATCVARILAKDKCLKIVSLANNPIGSMGAMALASAIASNSTLEKLNLSQCNIDDAGVAKLAASLKRNKSLKYLNLEGNPISSEGIHHLFKCIYDTSNGITSLWSCNHTIRSFNNGMTTLYSPSFPDTRANRLLSCKMSEILGWCNCRSTSRQIAASRKILRYFFKDEPDEYRITLENTEEKLVPHLMGWLGSHGDMGVVYDVVRKYPWLVEKKHDFDEDSGESVHGRGPVMIVENINSNSSVGSGSAVSKSVRKRKHVGDVSIDSGSFDNDSEFVSIDELDSSARIYGDERLVRKSCRGC